jgi:hypothetical protein
VALMDKVIHDMLGMNNEFSSLRRYMNLYEGMTTAIGQYVADVKSSDFPNEKNSINHLLKPPLFIKLCCLVRDYLL